MAQVTNDTIIADLLKMDRGVVPILLNNGMHCIGCPASSGESIQEACSVHGLDFNKIVSELNEFLDTKE